MSGELLDDRCRISFNQFLNYCRIAREQAVEMVALGLLEPIGPAPDDWSFVGQDVLRARAALRLAHDLEINLTAAGLILDLIDERNALRQRVRVLEELIDEL